jgi:putative peptidoglycan lipid II flippase
MTKAALLGTGVLSDAFSVAFMLPNLFRRLFAEGSIAVAFIPTFKEYLINDDAKQTKEFLCSFWTFLTFFVSIAVALGIVFAPALVSLFGLEDLDETALLTRVMFPFLLFISVASFFQGILNSTKVFAPSALAPIILNIVTIASAWLLKDRMENPARAMAAGIFIGGFLEAAIQFPFVIKKGFTFNWMPLIKALRNPGTKKVLLLIAPTILGMAAYQLNDLVSTALASNAGVGVVSSLQYSLRLQELILGVFAVSIGTIMLPELAEKAKQKDWSSYNKRLSESISVVALITIPVIFFSLSQGEYLIRLLFQTNEFNDDSVSLTLSVFIFHIGGLFFIALNRILAPAFYAQSDSLSPTIAGILSFAVNIILAFLLVGNFKGSGIALALSVAGFVNTFFLFLFLRKNKNILLKSILKDSSVYLLKIIIISLLAFVPLYIASPLIYNFIQDFNFSNRILKYALPLFICFLIFLFTALILLIISRDKYIKQITSVFTRRKKQGVL